MDINRLKILRHSLGVGDDGIGAPYRNHFVTGEGSTDYPHCMALVESGHMKRRAGNQLTGGDDVFTVTESGRLAARPAAPERMTRSQKRYRAFLDSDTGATFGEWIKHAHLEH